ncbi:signal peptidase II [Naumannella huperziae]
MPSAVDQHRAAAEVRPARWPALAIALGLAAALLSADQLAKEWALRSLTPGRSVPFVGELLQFRLLFNSGAAFSLGTGYTWIFSMLAIAAVIGIAAYALPRLRHPAWAVAIGLLLAGIGGNLVDRIARPPAPLRGEVVDLLQLPNWPIFNLADVWICSAAVLIIAMSIFLRRGLDGRLITDDATGTRAEKAATG